ncbi:TetR/AcrR family transcriptional regulator [Bradyrhizobium sp. B120]|uniref:TetR/AcrR family transcriptional regulator n=1 Tax=Bradyrhizobium sp. B120 TaxID=3410088 RepID=UPI003B97F419
MKQSIPPPPSARRGDAQPSPSRGRPRAYDSELVLEKITALFWQKGYEATSLDDISLAAGMKRPSLYLAFGNKEDMYLLALRRYHTLVRNAVIDELDRRSDIGVVLRCIYQRILSIYRSDAKARGCFTIASLSQELAASAAIQTEIREFHQQMGKLLFTRIATAFENGQLKTGITPAIAVDLIVATQHTIAVRSRVETADHLTEIFDNLIGLICSQPN